MSFEQRRLNHQEVAISGGPTAGPDANPDGTASAIDYSQSAGGVIGPYHLLQRIGVGGMGEVWLAEQKEPVRRRVAIKLIKARDGTREVVARFESERQALALMDHPAIAKVFDAGSTPQGRPYFVMEYVNGVPITTYCDKHRLTSEQRLDFCPGLRRRAACAPEGHSASGFEAVQYPGKRSRRQAGAEHYRFRSCQGDSAWAHCRHAVHAVRIHGRHSRLHEPGTGRLRRRGRGYPHRRLFPRIVLYELLVGALPLNLTTTSHDQFRSRLRDEVVPRPSTKLRTSADRSKTIAQERSSELTALLRQLRGDLDAITLRCLEKDRARRYATPADLTADIGRYLRHEPVVARPSGLANRIRKYVRRHRLGVAVVAGAVLLLLFGAIAQTVQLRRTQRERDRADRITKFMMDMFKVSNPSEARGNDIRAREILDKAAKDIETDLVKDPELQARMMHVMGTVYESLGLYSKAESLYKSATETRRGILGPANRDTLDSANKLGFMLLEESRFPEAEKLTRETMELRSRAFGPKDRDTLESATQLALILDDEGRFPEAEKLNRETMDIASRAYGPQDDSAGRARQHLAIDFAYEGNTRMRRNSFARFTKRIASVWGTKIQSSSGNMTTSATSCCNRSGTPRLRKCIGIAWRPKFAFKVLSTRERC